MVQVLPVSESDLRLEKGGASDREANGSNQQRQASGGVLFVSDETLFDLSEFTDWQKEWKGMPEYNNQKEEPLLTATFKFRTENDFTAFMEVVKRELYEGKRVFDGNQEKDKKSAWFPLASRPSEMVYVVEQSES